MFGKHTMKKLFKRKCLSKSIWMNHVTPFLVLISYSLIGSLAFYLVQRFANIPGYIADPYYVGKCADTGNASFGRAFYFVGTIFSSIGFGDIAACTWVGKLLTIILAVSGVPITLLCLGKFGRLLREVADYIWHMHLRKRPCPPKEERRFPLLLGIAIAACWVLIGALYFLYFMYAPGEQIPLSWNYFDALYFTIGAMFTIGFGDYVPSRRPLDVVTYGVIFVGLALVSMCVAIAQKRMESQFERMVGLIRDVYKQGKVRLGPRGQPTVAISKLSSAEQQVARVVLEMWKCDPTGLWLGTLLQQGGGASENRLTNRSMRIGPNTQRMIIDKWKRRTFTRSAHTQTDTSIHNERADTHYEPTIREDGNFKQNRHISWNSEPKALPNIERDSSLRYTGNRVTRPRIITEDDGSMII